MLYEKNVKSPIVAV